MKDNVFIDTNIFIYALTETENIDDLKKREIAVNFFEKSVIDYQIIISVQVVNEFWGNLIKKILMFR